MGGKKQLTTENFIKWATEQFKYTIKKDNIKKRKCENNGVKLLYYSNFNKKIVL